MRVYFMTNIGRENSDETADDAIESATNNYSGVDTGQIYKKRPQQQLRFDYKN